MSTVLEILTAARLLCRDPDGVDLTDELGMSFINNHIQLIHQTLINIQSDLLRAEVQVVTADGTAEYELTDTGDVPILATGVMPYGVWEDGFPGNPMQRLIKSELIARSYDLSDTGQPSFWYPVTPNKIGFCLTPDDVYTYNINYWKAYQTILATGDTVPYEGIFDQALIYWLVMEYNASIGADAGYFSVQFTNAYRSAMQYVYEYGTTKWTASGDMFSVDGV